MSSILPLEEFLEAECLNTSEDKQDLITHWFNMYFKPSNEAKGEQTTFVNLLKKVYPDEAARLFDSDDPVTKDLVCSFVNAFYHFLFIAQKGEEKDRIRDLMLTICEAKRLIEGLGYLVTRNKISSAHDLELYYMQQQKNIEQSLEFLFPVDEPQSLELQELLSLKSR
ncbi:MAG: hypothetical protein DHS20C18_11000 [Saprospiraceae bacterium]|nr:MAG: hypothetical protein DHS20C18_11000 [Saprospiraceae bacterium]